MRQAFKIAEENSGQKIHVLYSEDWHAGIIGLVAARITEYFSVPSVAISIGPEFSKGSARSIDGVNITKVLRECSDFLVDVGGHAGAAGFSLETKKIEQFKKKVETEMMKMEFNSTEKFLDIEAEIPFSKLTKILAKKIEEFDPFGLGNKNPLFCTRNMKITDIRTVGSGKHLKFKAEGIDAIAFSLGDLETFISSGQLINLAYYLEINKFNGRETLQLKVKDIQLS